MKKLLSSDKICISQSQIKGAGRGVFARTTIKENETIERCPVIDISENDTVNLGESILTTYFYYFGKNKERSAVVLGFGSIYNHNYTPNACYKENYEEQTVEFVALKDIKTGEEITVNYNQESPKGTDPLWFDIK